MRRSGPNGFHKTKEFSKGHDDTKKKDSKIALLCAAATAAALLTGCSVKRAAATGSDASAAGAGAPVTVQDAEGGDVVMYSAPQRLVALSVWESEMILDLVGTDRVAALNPYMDSDVITACADKASAVRARVTNEAEAIRSVSPDLVLLDNYTDSDGTLTQTLQEDGIKVLKLDSPSTFDDIRDRIRTIAAAVFAEEQGAQILQDMDDRLDAVRQKVSAVTTPVKVMMYDPYSGEDGEDGGTLYAYGQDSTFNEIAAAAGAVNVCTAASGSTVGKQTVVSDWKPDFIVVPGIAYEEKEGEDGEESLFTVSGDGSDVKAALKSDSILGSLAAVKNDKMAAISEKYRRSHSQYMAYAVEELAKDCYPDLFK